MRTWTETHRQGTDIGPIDWDESKWCVKLTQTQIGLLKALAESPDRYLARMRHSDLMVRVLNVCMYDGWPYWQPGPAIQFAGPLGPEWHFADWLENIKEIEHG